MPKLPKPTRRTLDRLAVEKQSDDRIPGLVAGVGRAGELVWSKGVGSADLDRAGQAPDADTQFDIASNTKTFVAVVAMALRDEGRLSLGDTVDQHIPESTHGAVTIRELLAHVSGMQREPVGDVWDTLEFPDREQLVTGWNAAERILPAHTVHHYSNLGYAVLAEVVARLEGVDDWFESVQRRILDPLGMTRTSLGRKGGNQAGRYYTPPWTDVPAVEPEIDPLSFSAAGGMASTLADLATWGAFVADPVAEVLSRDTLEEMCEPVVTADSSWSQAWGLGFHLVRHEDRLWVGHTGGHPGTISGVFTHRESATTGVVLMNNTGATAPATFAATIAGRVVDDLPPAPEPWVPGASVPPELEPLLGQWFSEGVEFVFSVRQGRLEAQVRRAPKGTPNSVFEPDGPDAFRTVSGRERGERLRVRRDAEGGVVAMNWATYVFTRRPYAFGEWLETPPPSHLPR
jgi:CubicO group peptidase (beta-lactamase class C family)